MKLNKSEKELRDMVTDKERINSFSFGMGTADDGKDKYFLPYRILRGSLVKAVLYRKEPKLEYYRLKKKKIDAHELVVKKNTNILVKLSKDACVYLINEDGSKSERLEPINMTDDCAVYELSFKAFLKTIIHDIAPKENDYGYYLIKDDVLEEDLKSIVKASKGSKDLKYLESFHIYTIPGILSQLDQMEIYEGSLNDEKKPSKFIAVYVHD